MTIPSNPADLRRESNPTSTLAHEKRRRVKVREDKVVDTVAVAGDEKPATRERKSTGKVEATKEEKEARRREVRKRAEAAKAGAGEKKKESGRMGTRGRK